MTIQSILLLKILVLYHSVDGGSLKLAEAIAKGAESYPHTKVVLKSISKARASELSEYDGIAFGSPVYFGSMSGEMKSFLDQTLDLWKSRELAGIPATVFMSAGSGLGNESAILSIWNVLASHGMILIPTGSLGMNEMDKSLPQGHTPFGITALNGTRSNGMPSVDEMKTAELQGHLLAGVANKLKVKSEAIDLPKAPAAVGNYLPYQISGKHVYINQIALQEGKVKFPGKIGEAVTIDEAKEAVHVAALNVLAVLKEAVGGDFKKVKNAVQLTGYFNAIPGFQDHALLMNEASNMMVKVLGDKGKHARATVGSSSLPLNSSTEIQAIFELK